MRITFLTVLFLFSAHWLSGFPVKGRIKDFETDEELIGATLVWKENPTTGAVTGLDGSFSIDHQNNSNTLVCSYIGYETTEYPVKNATSELTIKLKPAAKEMSEVVVYGDNTRNSENAARSIEKNAVNVVNVVSAKAIELSPDLTVSNVI